MSLLHSLQLKWKSSLKMLVRKQNSKVNQFFVPKIIFLFLLLSSTKLFAAEESKKQTICLNMIVKNEKEVIERCLESVLPIIDTWVIVDTGSTDGTQKVIKEYLKNIPGKLYERPWVNFAHNRQEALELAKNQADYILFMDADDILAFEPNFKMPHLSKDCYFVCTYAGGVSNWCKRLAKADKDWQWKGSVHEDLDCDQAVTLEGLLGVNYIYLHDGARSKDKNTIFKDIEALKSEIQKAPESPRNYFYLARAYETAQMPEQALQSYIKRSQLGGEEQELFMTNLRIGVLKQQLRYDFDEVEQCYLQAYLNKPYRSEALYYLACLECENENYEMGYKILQSALDLPKVFSDGIYCENWIYDYGLLIQLAYCARQTGRYLEGTKVCRELLEKNSLPENAKAKVIELLNSIYQVNVELVQEKITRIMANK